MELLRVHGLTKTFGGFQAVKGIDFSIGEGRCAALLGPNGAGKTTTIRMITGLLSPTSGTIGLAGAEASADRRSLIGYLPQIPSFYGWMSGFEYLVYAGRLCGLTGREAAARSKELLERVGIGNAGRRRIGGYSGGMKQRLGLAQALIHRPKLLVLDEPVSALDPVGRRDVMELLRALKKETTVLFSTHVLHDAEELCDDVLIMEGGRIAVQGSIEDVRGRYRKPALLVRTEEDAASVRWLAEWTEKNKTSGDVLEAEPQADGMRLIVRDVDGARRSLLKGMAEADVKVRQLEIGYTSLEELFMKVVAG